MVYDLSFGGTIEIHLNIDIVVPNEIHLYIDIVTGRYAKALHLETVGTQNILSESSWVQLYT